jgi:hypothetical protein
MPSPSEIAREEEWAKDAEVPANGTVEKATLEEQYLAKQRQSAALRLDIVHRERELADLRMRLDESEADSAGFLRELRGPVQGISEEARRARDLTLYPSLKDIFYKTGG